MVLICNTLGYGVMVTLQILVLSFLVRVRVPQLEKEKASKSEAFFLLLFFLALGINGLDLLTDDIHVVLEFLHLAVHLIDKVVALL